MSRERSEVRGQQEVVKLRKWEGWKQRAWRKEQRSEVSREK